MSSGIIQTAISSRLPLELIYREPSRSDQSSVFQECFACAPEQFDGVAASSSDEFKQILRMV